MPIRTQSVQNIPFLISYQAYTPSAGTVIVEYPQDMVAYSLYPSSSSTQLNYAIGAQNTYSASLAIKNVTNNTRLKIQITYDNMYFTIKNPDTNTIQSPINFLLNSQQTKVTTIELNKTYLNQQTNYTTKPASIIMSITNEVSNTVVTKNISVSLPVSQSLPSIINVT